MNVLKILGRERMLFQKDLERMEDKLSEEIGKSSFLVIGGAGSIGSATVKEIFRRKPKILHVVDINENNLTELVRDIRSSLGYIEGDFRTFCIDAGSPIFNRFFDEAPTYDYVLNFSALKHVRSEKDPYTLMRMIEVNILNTVNTLEKALGKGTKKYFCVSTDKAANPVNMMGASKRIMEFFLFRYSDRIKISTARFANVAFSEGSLLFGFNQRIQKRQPLPVPVNVKRYFMTQEESGILCLLSAIFGDNREIFFPKLSEDFHLTSFLEITERYLEQMGYKPYPCESEDEARHLVEDLPDEGFWPCLFFETDTTGEKEIEEFYTEGEEVDWNKFEDIAIIKSSYSCEDRLLDYFLKTIEELKSNGWKKSDLVELFKSIVPNFEHYETGKYLDDRM